MSESKDRGPAVAGHEMLYRAITYPRFWNSLERRVSSAAFAYPVFSVDRALLISVEDSLRKFRKGCGLTRFNYGQARELGFDAREEADDRFPANVAHAHVYCDFGSNQRSCFIPGPGPGSCRRDKSLSSDPFATGTDSGVRPVPFLGEDRLGSRLGFLYPASPIH